MSLPLPPNASSLFQQGNDYHVDNGKVLAYGLRSVSQSLVNDVCEDMTNSYAKEILNWPKGRIDKPEVFFVVEDGPFDSLSKCAEHFVEQLRTLLETTSPEEDLSLYPHAFIAIAQRQGSQFAVLFVAHCPEDDWLLEYREIPIQVEMGLIVTSLTMGDITEADMLEQNTKIPDDL